MDGDAAADALAAPPVLGEADTAALVCARRRREDMGLGRTTEARSRTRETKDGGNRERAGGTEHACVMGENAL